MQFFKRFLSGSENFSFVSSNFKVEEKSFFCVKKTEAAASPSISLQSALFADKSSIFNKNFI